MGRHWINRPARHTVKPRFHYMPATRLGASSTWIPAPSAFACAASAFGLMALLTPLGDSEAPGPRAGFLLAFAAGRKCFTASGAPRPRGAGSIHRLSHQPGDRHPADQRPLLAAAALFTGMGASWPGCDQVRRSRVACPDSSSRGHVRTRDARQLVVALLLIRWQGWLRKWTVAVAVALRIFGTAWNIVTSPVHTAADAEETVVADLGVGDHPAIARMTAW